MSLGNLGGTFKFAAIRVLVVAPDNLETQRLLEAMERAGLSAITASTGSAAATLSGSTKIDVVLVALALPDASALDVIAWFDRTPSGVIALGGSEAEGERILALELGADDATTADTSTVRSSPASAQSIAGRIAACPREKPTTATCASTSAGASPRSTAKN